MPSGHVLIVEDDDTIRHLLIEYLKQHALLTVEGARDGIEALHFISQKPYAIVILDLMMPKMSGGDFLDSLTAMMKDPSIHTLAVRLAGRSDDLEDFPTATVAVLSVEGTWREVETAALEMVVSCRR